MATIKLVPSTYSVSNTTVTVSNPDNMYTNTSSTNYATITHTTSGTTSYYLYLKGFNFNDVPSNANVSSIAIKIKGYESGLATSTSYAPRLYNNTSTITGASAASSNFGTSTNTITVPYTGTWATLKGYGANLGIRLTVRRNSRNTQCYIYVYGAEIEVTYTVPVYHTITASTTDGTISPSGSTSLLEGSDYTLTINVDNPTVTDNNIDVTSQLVRMTSGTSVFTPYDYEYSGFSISNITNAYNDVSNTTYANCSLNGRTTGNLYLLLGPINLPSGSTISSVSCQVCYQVSRNGSSSSMTASCQLYTGSTAKGSQYTIVSSATDVSKTTVTLTPGSWTASELSNARLFITMYNGASSTVRRIYVYGVSFSVTYTVSGEVYTYTITNVVGDHTIVVTAGQIATIYYKNNGSWVQVSEVYKKVNGLWVKQTDLTNVFDNTKNYVKG